MSTPGKFIVIYGINNLGKTLQAKKLVERLLAEGRSAEYLKYPLYDSEPTGHMINDYLRHGNPDNLSTREVQILYSLDRLYYQPTLLAKLNQGINIVAEDYCGTGLAWGIGNGVDEKFMRRINHVLKTEDLVFLFDGDRFSQAQEPNHKHENDETLVNKVRAIHSRLGQEFGWQKINANDTIENIHEIIWTAVKKII